MTTIQSSGIEPGQRRLNGPQTTGRNYRNLSQPAYGMTRDDDVAVLMRDGVALLADVHRPTEPGRYPVLVAVSPYPRQIKNLGLDLVQWPPRDDQEPHKSCWAAWEPPAAKISKF
jgi:uncharacterized protein